jgi:hypothetical protein
MKPTSNNIVSFQKYVVCKHFMNEPSSIHQKEKHDYYENLLESFEKYQETNNVLPVPISSLVKGELPCFFLSKINDINIILGQQQLEMIQQMILFLKNKNKEKMNQMIKMHIAKSIKWCEKFKIPHGGQSPLPSGPPCNR